MYGFQNFLHQGKFNLIFREFFEVSCISSDSFMKSARLVYFTTLIDPYFTDKGCQRFQSLHDWLGGRTEL